MSKLLARARVKLENAERNYIKIGQDDAYLDDCCYNLQQAVELGLKYIIEMQGENYPETHDIRAQLNKIRSLDIELPWADDIRHLASTVNGWEAESRYNDDFTSLIEDVDEVLDIARQLLRYCGRFVQVLED